MGIVNFVSVLLLHYLVQEEYVYTDPMTMYRQCNCYLRRVIRVIDVMSQVTYVPNFVDDMSQKQNAK